MPETLPARQWGPNDWREDCPVTVQGQFQAKLTGEHRVITDLIERA